MSGEQGSVRSQWKTLQHQLEVEANGSIEGEVIGEDENEVKKEEETEQPESDFQMDELDSSTASSGSAGSEDGSDMELSVAESWSDDEDWIPRGERKTRIPQHRYNLRQTRTASERYTPIRSPPPRRAGNGGRGQWIVGLRAELSAAKLDLDRLREENAALLAVQTGHDFALSLAREWMAKLVGGEGKRVEALATIFDLIKDGSVDKKSLDPLFERLVLQTQ